MDLVNEMRKSVKGEVLTTAEEVSCYKNDASIFELTPSIVIAPSDAEDVEEVVKSVAAARKKRVNASITARSGGTDMSGGGLTDSILLDFPKHFNKFSFEDELRVKVQPGVYYRDLEAEMDKRGIFLPSYPASKSICCLGGMIANNSGGEKTLFYGKTKDYISKLKVVLADGKEYEFKKLNKKELAMKMKRNSFEGQVYRKMYYLLEKNYDLIKSSKPKVKKNSAGYYLWDVWDRENFDLTQLFAGSQGTLGIITEAELNLVKKKNYHRLVACFLKTTEELVAFVNAVLPYMPESLETFDDATLRLALKFMPEIASKSGKGRLAFLWSLRREALMTLLTGLPKFTVLVELAEDEESVLKEKLAKLDGELKSRKIKHLVMKSEEEGKKYWIIRRESFNLLRKKVKDKHAAAFIDDFAVNPEHLPEFWPQLEKILRDNGVPQTIAGHAGSGNFHVIPIMDLSKEEDRKKIHKVSEEVYTLVAKYGGTITAEHNDGLIRTPYLDKMFSPKMIELFEKTKDIFDPHGIFNPGKKVHGDIEEAMQHVRKEFN